MRQQDDHTHAFLIFSNYCRGLGTVTVPSGVQGQSPCMNGRAFPKAHLRSKWAQRAQNAPQGHSWRAAARPRADQMGRGLEKKPFLALDQKKN